MLRPWGTFTRLRSAALALRALLLAGCDGDALSEPEPDRTRSAPGPTAAPQLSEPATDVVSEPAASTEVEVGACVSDVGSLAAPPPTVVDCYGPHVAQLVAEEPMPEPYPDDPGTWVLNACSNVAAPYLNLYTDEVLQLTYQHPTADDVAAGLTNYRCYLRALDGELDYPMTAPPGTPNAIPGPFPPPTPQVAVTWPNMWEGMCYNQADAYWPDGTTHWAVPPVDCGEPHDGQVFHVSHLAFLDTYPGDDAIDAEGEATCTTYAEPIQEQLGGAAPPFYWRTPTELQWNHGDKAVVCLFQVDTPVTGTF